MGYKFGERSAANLATAHKDLQIVMTTAIKSSMVDFGISEGHRSLERQKELFDEGKSRIDGITKKGKHNYNPQSKQYNIVLLNSLFGHNVYIT